jgi:hypothetical protein
MLLDAIDNAVISVCSLVIALEALPALFGAEFLQLGHDTRGYNGCSFGVEKVHEGLVELELSMYRMGEEIRIYKDRVGRTEGSVGLEEESG